MRYKNLIIEDTNTSATDEEIAAIEKELGCSLPSDYVEFLQTCNGGYLEYDILVEFEEEPSEYLSFCSLYKAGSSNEWESNPFELSQEKNVNGFPQGGVLPIARNGGSSVLSLDLREEYRVVAYIQGLPEWTGLRQKDALMVLANSFDEYWQKLTISDETIEGHIENFEANEFSAQATIDWFDSIGSAWRKKYRKAWNVKVPFNQV